MKHIVIDARLYGPSHTGLGRYTKNLLIALKNLPKLDKYKYTLLVYPELRSQIENDLGKSFNYISTNLRHYSLREQLLLPKLLNSLQPDLVHFTHLDKPILYFGKSVVTVHDLIRHFSKGSETTTKNKFLYWPKYWGYLIMTKFILLSSYIIVPSNFWREYILNHYHFEPRKIITTYEAVDPKFLLKSPPKQTNDLIAQNYLIYTGNLYPHKNIEIVLSALKDLPQIKLKIICARSIFTSKIERLIESNSLQKQVEFLGFVPDQKFPKIYQQALALVHPSLLEGFSLTGLEAMALGCPVIAANASCLPEVYEDSVLYFDPKNEKDLVKQIMTLQNSPKLRKTLIEKGFRQVEKYSWNKTAKNSFAFYEKILNEKS